MTERPSAEDAAAGLGHELKMLVDLVVDHSAPWLERVRATASGADDPLRAAAEQHAEGGEHAGFNCGGWCPICAAVGTAKGQPPEFTARAFEQAAQAVALVRAVLADRWHPEEGVHMPGFEPPAPAEPRSGGVEAAEEAVKATLRASNAPKVAFTATQSRTQERVNGHQPRGESPRVQRVPVRKAQPESGAAGEQRP